MSGNHSRLFDESVLLAIMNSTAVRIGTQVESGAVQTKEEICHLVDQQAQEIITDTLAIINQVEPLLPDDGESEFPFDSSDLPDDPFDESDELPW